MEENIVKTDESYVNTIEKPTLEEAIFLAKLTNNTKVELCRSNISMVPTFISIMKSMNRTGGYIERLQILVNGEVVEERVLGEQEVVRRKIR